MKTLPTTEIHGEKQIRAMTVQYMDFSSDSDHSGIIGEKLCTIVEENTRDCSCGRHAQNREARRKINNTKSITINDFQTLHNNGNSKHVLTGSPSDTQLKHSHYASHCRRSFLAEMGDRIRLFSAASFVRVNEGGGIAKTQSLNIFPEQKTAQPYPAHQQARGAKRAPKRAVNVRIPPLTRDSVVSLAHNSSDDVEPYDLSRTTSQLGMLCQHCSTADTPCPKAQEVAAGSAYSLSTVSQNSLSSGNDPLCRICHCTWPSDPMDPLISPCRCSGSLQHVHLSCLMHWLDISSRKLHRPAVCELCLYKYRRRRVIKCGEMHLPDCPSADLRYYCLFICALLLMTLSATATLLCFQMEKKYNTLNTNRTSPAPSPPSSTDSDIVPPLGDAGNLLSTVTLTAAILFFLSFFLAMYAHVKSSVSLCNYLAQCWSSNLEWSIEEYKESKDTQYMHKLGEMRRKIQEKQKKTTDESEPLHTNHNSSVIVIE